MSKIIKDVPDHAGKWGMIKPKGSCKENDVYLCEIEDQVIFGEKSLCVRVLGYIDTCYPLTDFSDCKWFEIEIPDFEPF